MASYPPPTDNFPIFDSLAFLTPLNATITVAEADTKYLARQDIAVSVAQTTSFSDNITIGNSLLDYIPAQGLQIKPTVNSEAVFIRTLDNGGNTIQRIECNETHTHLYDTTRLTESATPANYSTLQQSGSTLDIYNTVSNGFINFRVESSVGSVVTPLIITQPKVTISPSTIAVGTNGLVLNSAFFGRNDTTANIFGGVLGYTRHPIGWTIKVSKAVATWTSGVAFDVIATGTANTEFTALSNGVWKFGCCFNNTASLGTSSFLVSAWGTPTGGTILNGNPATTSPYNQATVLMTESASATALTNFGFVMPEATIQMTGSGVTNIQLWCYAQFTVQPTYTFNIFATKIG
jgi:hypothetical protein